MNLLPTNLNLIMIIVSLSISSFSLWLIVFKNKDRYIMCAIGFFIAGAAFALLRMWYFAIPTAFLIIIIGALHTAKTTGRKGN
jgi:hypothetical protein